MGTMQDMDGMARAIVDYVTDVGYAPEQAGPIIAGSNFRGELMPFYRQVGPILDQWGTAFHVNCGTGIESARISGVTAGGPDAFLVISYGRDGASTPFSLDPSNSLNSFFGLTASVSFNHDLLIWNGSWIHAPKTGQLGLNQSVLPACDLTAPVSFVKNDASRNFFDRAFFPKSG